MTARPSWLVELERTAKSATEGPWYNDDMFEVICGIEQDLEHPFPAICSTDMNSDLGDAQNDKNAEYIAALSPDRVLALLALVEELHGALAGVVLVADRKTDEFDAARSAIARYQAGPGSEGGTK